MRLCQVNMVVLFLAGFIRPVVLLGPIADITRDKLLQDMPETFAIPSKNCKILLSTQMSLFHRCLLA